MKWGARRGGFRRLSKNTNSEVNLRCNMKDCSICKYCDEDFDFDEETGEEYPVFECQKGNDTSLDYECKDFEKYKPQKYKEKNTECDICEYREKCAKYSSGIDCTTCGDTKTHIIYPQDKCIKRAKELGIEVQYV